MPPSSVMKSRRFTTQYLPCSEQRIAQQCCAAEFHIATLRNGLLTTAFRVGRRDAAVENTRFSDEHLTPARFGVEAGKRNGQTALRYRHFVDEIAPPLIRVFQDFCGRCQ
jgi:hypothetical protein